MSDLAHAAAPVLSTRGLGKSYGPRRGVEGLNLEVGDGDIFGFLGPNGAGKTTAIRLLLGFLRPSTGQASIFGRDCWRHSRRIKREVGYLAGDVRLYPWLTVRNALGIVGAARGRKLDGPGLSLAERFRLDPDVPVRKMSRGMRQKLGLIMALAAEPRLLVLDEPTSGLDPIIQQELAHLLRERARDGATIFFSSHTLSEVEQLCDRVAIVREGRIVADEPLEDLRGRARRKVMVRFATVDDAERVEPPPGLSLLDRDRDRWEAELEGEANTLGPWLNQPVIRDFTIGPPDLETIFHAYYRGREEAD